MKFHNHQIIKLSNHQIYHAAAEYIIAVANKAVAERGKFIISLSGGNTPQKLYSLLSKPPYCKQIEWKKTFIFWCDERCVPLNDTRNNAHQAKLTLLDKIDIPSFNIHRIPVNLPPAKAATVYEKEVKDFFKYEARPHRFRRACEFDLILLGLGENGHTASLFPGTNVLNEKEEGVRELYIEKEKMFRVTLTAPIINRAHRILFLVTGEKKAKILKNVLTASYQPNKYPAQLIKPIDGNSVWLVDKTAASLIK